MEHAGNAQALIFACSPRAGGNSERAALALAEGVTDAGGEVRIEFLRKRTLLPCLGCGACATSPGHRCVLAGRDEAEELFAAMLAARRVFFSSPIFFYHLPALFKGFIDRGQSYWERMQAGDPGLTGRSERDVGVVFVAGRPRGEKLFEGSMLTLRFFLMNFRMRPAEPRTFRGIDRPGDLDADAEALRSIREYAADLWRSPA